MKIKHADVRFDRLFSVFILSVISCLIVFSGDLLAANPDQQATDAEEDKRTSFSIVPGVPSKRLRLLVDETNEKLEDLFDHVTGLSTTLDENRVSIKQLTLQLEVISGQLEHQANPEIPVLLSGILTEVEEVVDEISKEAASDRCKNNACDLSNITGPLSEGIQELKTEIEELGRLVANSSPTATEFSELISAIQGISHKQTSGGSTQQDPVSQIPLSINLTEFYPDAEIEYSFVSLPDPRVPRHRRAFENSLASITGGFSKNDFTLDRYYFPWQNYLDEEGGLGNQSQNCHLGTVTIESWSSRQWDGKYCFGMLVYRKDEWRKPAEKESSRLKLRVLYIIPETVTYGVMTGAVYGAIGHLAKLGADAQAMQFDQMCKSKPHTMVVGPAFSGSTYLLSETFKKAIQLIRPTQESKLESICMVSWSGTANSNACIQNNGAMAVSNDCIENNEKYVDSNTRTKSNGTEVFVEFHKLGSTDVAKLKAIGRIRDTLNVPPKKVFFYLERSTFGKTVCQNEQGDLYEDVCLDGDETIFTFNANIADIRARNSLAKSMDPDLPFGIGDSELDALRLDDASENGSEYPSSNQSFLASVGMELKLEMQIANLQKEKPEIIVIAATEVRDRLFLIRKFRRLIPGALIIDFETDLLLAHPAFIDSTRGVLQLGSAEIVKVPGSQSQSVAQSEHQVLLRKLFQALDPPGSLDSKLGSDGKSADGIYINVIGREGPLPIKKLYTDKNAAKGKQESSFWLFKKSFFWLFITMLFVAVAHWWLHKNITTNKIHTSKAKWSAQVYKGFISPLEWISFGSLFLFFTALVSHSLYLNLEGDHLSNEWDLGLVLILFMLLWFAFQSAHVWSESEDDSWFIKLKKLPYSYSHVYNDRFGSTASAGVWLGVLAICIMFLPIFTDFVETIFENESQGNLLSSSNIGVPLVLQSSMASGLTWSLPFLGTVVATLYAAMIITSVTVCRRQNEAIWSHLIKSFINVNDDLKSKKGSMPRLLHFGFLVVFAFALFKAFPLGVSAFGNLNDLGFFLALCGTSVTALGSFCLALHLYERLEHVLSVTRRRAVYCDSEKRKFALFQDVWAGFDPEDEEYFSRTVILANPKWDHQGFKKSEQVSNSIWENEKKKETTAMRMNLRELISRDVWCIRNLVILNLLACLASVLLVYCYPVPSRDWFLSLNMFIMVMVGILFAIATIRLERNAVASPIVSDRDKTLSWSFSFINSMSLPFIMIAITVTISEVPGVREVAGDWLTPLLRLIGL